MKTLVRAAAIVAATLLSGAAMAGCGDGEDRPGQVTSESDNPSGSGTGSASGTGSPSGSASGSGSGTHAGKHEGGSQADFSKADADTAVDVNATEFRFEGIPATVRGPKVFFTVRNRGGIEHEFDVKGHGAIEPFGADQTETLALELEPGDYKVVCLVEEGDKTHEELGMVAEFTVTAT